MYSADWNLFRFDKEDLSFCIFSEIMMDDMITTIDFEITNTKLLVPPLVHYSQLFIRLNNYP